MYFPKQAIQKSKTNAVIQSKPMDMLSGPSASPITAHGSLSPRPIASINHLPAHYTVSFVSPMKAMNGASSPYHVAGDSCDVG